MKQEKILYHPRFEPNESWLKTMLLFYDTVHSIVPEKAGFKPSPRTAALQDKLGGGLVPLEPREEDLQYDWNNYDGLASVLRQLPEKGEVGKDIQTRLEWFDGVPKLELGNSVSVHNDKMADMLVNDLVELGLAKHSEKSDWLQVDRRIAELVLSMLADRMVMNRPDLVGSSSDQEMSFAVAASSELKHGQAVNVEATLASAILTAEIPADIADLPINQYLDLRKRYEDKREFFRLAMVELQTLYFHRSFQNPQDFEKQLNEIVADFGNKMEVLRKGHFATQLRRWVPVAIGGVAAIAAAAISSPILAIGSAGVSLGLQVLQTSGGGDVAGTNVSKTQSLLIQLGRDLKWNRSWLGRVFSY